MSRKPSQNTNLNHSINTTAHNNPNNPNNLTNLTNSSNQNKTKPSANQNNPPNNASNSAPSNASNINRGRKRQLSSSKKAPISDQIPSPKTHPLTQTKQPNIPTQTAPQNERSPTSIGHSDDSILNEKKYKKEDTLEEIDEDWDENSSDRDQETNTSVLAKQLEDELGQVLSDTQDNWTIAQSRSKQASIHPSNNSNTTEEITPKLPAIKFFISLQAVEAYKSPVAVAKEIEKCMGTNLEIKFASLKGNLLIIATDDKVTHQKLHGIWPDNAFTFGLKPLTKQNEETPKPIIIRGVDPSVDMNDTYVVEQLRFAGLNFNKRLFNTKTNKETSVIKLTSLNLAWFKLAMRQGVRIGYQTFKAEPEHRVLQCFKCQKSGHSAWNCIYEQVCLKCSGPHSHKECTTSELKCANCQQNHAVCSRQCPSLQRPKSSIKKPIGTILSGPSGSPCPKPTFSQVLSQPNRSNNQHASPAKLQKNIEDMITVSIEAKINELMVTLTNHITKLITNLLAPISQNNPINNINLTSPRPQKTLQQEKARSNTCSNPLVPTHFGIPNLQQDKIGTNC